MQLIDARTARISLDIFDRVLTSNRVPANTTLWEYHKKNSINGVPIRLQDRGLNIDNLTDLMSAFLLKSLISVWSGWLSPLYADSLKLYLSIKQSLTNNQVYIIDLKMQYSPTKDAYLVLLTYAKILHILNDRYSFYKLDLING